jgi:hypothetical protein
MTTATAQAFELTARAVLDQKTLADGLFAPVFTQYLANR